MANATITVLEADGTTETDVVVLDVGRQAAAASKSVAASTEDKAVLDAIAASLALLDNSIASGNELQVDIVGSLPAGTAAIGKLAANSGVDIGDVDVTSLPAIPAGTNNIGKVKVTNDAGTVIDPVAAVSGGVPVINATSQRETVAASQTAQVIGATGATGDYLSHVICSPATAGCGVVTIMDDTTEIAAFPGGGTTALSNLIPFVIPIACHSTAGAWKITTGANIKCVAVGKFT